MLSDKDLADLARFKRQAAQTAPPSPTVAETTPPLVPPPSSPVFGVPAPAPEPLPAYAPAPARRTTAHLLGGLVGVTLYLVAKQYGLVSFEGVGAGRAGGGTAGPPARPSLQAPPGWVHSTRTERLLKTPCVCLAPAEVVEAIPPASPAGSEPVAVAAFGLPPVLPGKVGTAERILESMVKDAFLVFSKEAATLGERHPPELSMEVLPTVVADGCTVDAREGVFTAGPHSRRLRIHFVSRQPTDGTVVVIFKAPGDLFAKFEPAFDQALASLAF